MWKWLEKAKKKLLGYWFLTDLEVELDLKDEDLIETPIETDEFELEGVKEFLEDFLGVVIIGFETYDPSVPNLESDIEAKLISEVSLDGENFTLGLSSLNGVPAGSLVISPSIEGQFAESIVDERALNNSMYRLIFYGGDSFDYLDSTKKGTVVYQDLKVAPKND